MQTAGPYRTPSPRPEAGHIIISVSLVTPRLTLPSSPTATACLGCTCPGCYLRLPHGMTLLPVRQLAGVLARCQRLNLRHGCPCFVSTRLLFITGYHPRSPFCSRQVTDPPERVGWQVSRFALCDSRTMRSITQNWWLRGIGLMSPAMTATLPPAARRRPSGLRDVRL